MNYLKMRGIRHSNMRRFIRNILDFEFFSFESLRILNFLTDGQTHVSPLRYRQSRTFPLQRRWCEQSL